MVVVHGTTHADQRGRQQQQQRQRQLHPGDPGDLLRVKCPDFSRYVEKEESPAGEGEGSVAGREGLASLRQFKRISGTVEDAGGSGESVSGDVTVRPTAEQEVGAGPTHEKLSGVCDEAGEGKGEGEDAEAGENVGEASVDDEEEEGGRGGEDGDHLPEGGGGHVLLGDGVLVQPLFFLVDDSVEGLE